MDIKQASSVIDAIIQTKQSNVTGEQQQVEALQLAKQIIEDKIQLTVDSLQVDFDAKVQEGVALALPDAVQAAIADTLPSNGIDVKSGGSNQTLDEIPA